MTPAPQTDRTVTSDLAVVADLADHAWSQMQPAMMRAVLRVYEPRLQTEVAVTIVSMALGQACSVVARHSGRDSSYDSIREVTLAILEGILDHTAGDTALAAAEGRADE